VTSEVRSQSANGKAVCVLRSSPELCWFQGLDQAWERQLLALEREQVLDCYTARSRCLQFVSFLSRG